MKPDFRVNSMARGLSVVISFILMALPFHAVFSTWAGTNWQHLDLVRIWKEILILLLLPPTVWLAWRAPAVRAWFRNTWLAKLILAYFILSLALGYWALQAHQVNRVALIYGLIINLRFLGFFLICLVIGAYSDFIKRQWVKILLLPAAVVVGFGLVQRFILPYDFLKHFGYGPKTIPAYQTVDASLDFRRIQSTLRGANPLGAYLSLIIPALVRLKRSHLKWLYLASALALLFFSFSRSAWLGTGVSLAFIGWQVLRTKISWRYLLALCIGLIVGSSVLLATLGSNTSFQETLFHISSRSKSPLSSNAQRASALRQAGSDVIHQPLGEGVGSAGPASFRNNHPPRIAENYYLQIGQEIGVAGMLIFLAINALVGLNLWRRRADALAQVLLASLIGITFINLVSHAWTDDTLSLIWWGLAGVALAPAILLPKGKKANAQR